MGGVLLNRMTLREGPQALDAERLGRAAEALHLALMQSAPPEPGADCVISVFSRLAEGLECPFPAARTWSVSC